MKKKQIKSLVTDSDIKNIQNAIRTKGETEFNEKKDKLISMFSRILNDHVRSGIVDLDRREKRHLTLGLNELWDAYREQHYPRGYCNRYSMADALFDLSDFIYQTNICRMIVGGRRAGIYAMSRQDKRETMILRFSVECVYGQICYVTIRPSIKHGFTMRFVN